MPVPNAIKASELSHMFSDGAEAVLVMSDTTAYSATTEYLTDIVNLDECDSAGYSRQLMTGIEIATQGTEAVMQKAGGGGDFLFTWPALPEPSRDIVGMYLVKLGATPNIYCWFPFAAPALPNGTDFSVRFSANNGRIVRMV